jgi:phosphatidylserine/phosphatidylglycerophosphate/cardiolipin synthase-like enzyme
MYTTHYSNPASVVPIDTTLIHSATKTISMAAYALVDPPIIAALLDRAANGVLIDVYLDRTELEAEARGDALLSRSPLHALLNIPGIAIKVKQSSILMHLKSYLVDGVTLRDGSANFSPAGEQEQDNSLTLTDDPQAAALFAQKFAAMWARPDNLTVAQAVQAHGKPAAEPIAHLCTDML